MTEHPAFLVPLTIAWALTIGGVAFWILAATRLQRVRRDPPTIRRGLRLSPPPDGWGRVSVVVPAHDEERVIERCCRSLMAQDHPDFEVIFVLDRCTSTPSTRAVTLTEAPTGLPPSARETSRLAETSSPGP